MSEFKNARRKEFVMWQKRERHNIARVKDTWKLFLERATHDNDSITHELCKARTCFETHAAHGKKKLSLFMKRAAEAQNREPGGFFVSTGTCMMALEASFTMQA